MKYLLLLYDNLEAVEAIGADGRRTLVDEHRAYNRMLEQRGVHVLSEPLDGPQAARTIRFDGGVATVTDGLDRGPGAP